MKICCKCLVEKLESEFHRASHHKDGLRSRCRACLLIEQKEWRRRNPERARAAHKRWYDSNPEKVKVRNQKWNNRDPEERLDYTLRRNFGITAKDFRTMLDTQKGVCAICKRACRSGKRLAVDHNHKTGQVRALLCQMCNHGVGNFEDCPLLLQEASKYLEKFSPQSAEK